jgi:cell division transport system permease protein
MPGREIKWAFRSIWRGKGRSLAAISVTAVTIFLVSTTLLLGLAGMNFGQTAKERFTIPVYLVKGSDQAIAQNLATEIEKMPGVKSVVIKSPQDQMNEAEGLLTGSKKGTVVSSIGFNPFGYSLEVIPTDPDKISELSRQIETFTDVEDVVNDPTVIMKFLNIFAIFRWIALGLALISILVSSMVISLTIALSITSRRQEIEIMSLVGASPSTIIAPFIIEGMFYGFVGGSLAAGLVFFSWKYITEVFASNLPWFDLAVSDMTFLLILAATVGFGLFTGLFASWYSAKGNLGRIQA